MKKLIFILIAAIGLTISSCKKLEEYNVDTKSATAVPGSTLFSNALRNLVDQETVTSVNSNIFRAIAQYWTETTYPDESNYDITTRQIPDREFRTIYRDVLANLKEAKRVIGNETSLEINADKIKKNEIAVTEILSVYGFQREVDIFGNIPYEEALDIANVLPKYDDAKTIYSKLFTRLDAAIADIDVTVGGFKDGDLIYSGDMTKWKMFANCLKLKMAVAVADVSDLNPGAKATSAVAGGVFTSSADNATFPYLSSSPNTNPIWVDLVASGRYDWVPANTIVDAMNLLNDPRRPFYFEQNLGAGIYLGGIYGDNNAYSSFSHITETIQAPDWRGLLISYSEVQFYLAEAAARGMIAGDPATFYNNGITASIVDDWAGDPGDAAAYIATPAVAYDNSMYKQKIGLQAWISSYDRGLHGWDIYRRLDFPVMNLPALTNEPVPNRYTYPASEQTLNGANYSAASSAIGGDAQSTKLFWDKQ